VVPVLALLPSPVPARGILMEMFVILPILVMVRVLGTMVKNVHLVVVVLIMVVALVLLAPLALAVAVADLIPAVVLVVLVMNQELMLPVVGPVPGIPIILNVMFV